MKQRNYGIDLIRVVSMFLVVLIHNLGQGGILKSFEPLTFGWFNVFILEGIGIVAVNLFALITGYLAFSHKARISRILEVLVTTVFWSWFIVIVLTILKISISKKELFWAFTGIGNYWYIMDYFGLMVIAYVIRPFLQSLTKKQFSSLVGFLLFFSCTFGFVIKGFWTIYGGYSVSWLIVLYVIGFYIAEYQEMIFCKISHVKLWLLYLLGNILTVLVQIVVSYLQGFPKLGASRAYSYVNPTVILMSLSLFLILLQFQPRKKISKKILAHLSAVALGVYLIDQSTFYSSILKDLWIPLTNYSLPVMIISIVIISGMMYLLFGFMEYLRIRLFNKFKVRTNLEKIDAIRL